MSLQDYLAKHYGAASEASGTDNGKKKSKKKQSKPHSSFGISVVVDDDDDACFAPPSADSAMHNVRLQQQDISASTLSKKKELYKPVESTWTPVLGPAKRTKPKAHEDEYLDEEERPVIAEGAELVKEYNQKRQEEYELAIERKRKRREAKRATKVTAVSKETPAISPQPVERFGLQTAQTFKKDSDRARDHQMRQIPVSADPGASGDTVYRDPKTGKRLDIDKVRAQDAEKKQRQHRLRAQQVEWNKGIVQQRARVESQNLVESMRTGTSSSSGDAAQALNSERRDRMLWDDPALQFLENKKQEVHKFPVYKGQAPPNRFNIRPGYRWDGVDRSNGFEADYFKRQAASSARQAETYASSVADW
ncbi:Pre-mRNA-splicing factor cwc26 [Coemansia sp. IMI 203386]|nr:Pre-mRNA-splicing factor cwc26 [Coemansia sp. IMI 203386]